MDKYDLIMVTGGARSGKSEFALEKAASYTGNKAYLATAEALDDEMLQRVTLHRKSRGPDWATIEEPINICNAVKEAQGSYQVVLMDCLTIWISNLLTRISLNEEEARGRIEEFVAMLPSLKCNLVVVTNEVGMGVVPENPLARLFRDLAGLANQKLRKAASEAYFMVSGFQMKLK